MSSAGSSVEPLFKNVDGYGQIAHSIGSVYLLHAICGIEIFEEFFKDMPQDLVSHERLVS